jgi:phosphatidylglycerophosphate synthase
MMKTRFPFRLLAGIFGVLLLVFLIRRAGPANLLESISALGWRLSLVIALGGVGHVVKTWAWRLTLLGDKREVSFARTLALRLASEAAGQLGFLGQMFGENLRVLLLGSTIPLASGIASVTLDRALFILSGVVISSVGLIAVLVAYPLPHALLLYAGLSVSILLGVILAAALAVRRRWPVVSGAAGILGRIRFLGGWTERQGPLIDSVEQRLLNFYHSNPGAFWGSFALNLAGHGAAIFEVYLILHLLGAKITFLAALAIEALTKMINIVGLFNPGNIGTYEGGNMLIAKMFGLTAAAGLTLGIARRVRAIFWAAVGGLCVVVLSKSKRRASSGQPETQSVSRGSHVAVILANKLVCGGLGSRLPRVGALPVLLRAILGAQKAGARRIAVVVDKEARSSIVRDLKSTGRLPASIEWFELDVETSLTSLLGQIIGAGDSTVVLITGDRTYHPSLHRRAAEWEGNGGALALGTSTRVVGIYALSGAVAQGLANGQASIHSLGELDACLASIHSVETEPVDEAKWQRVSTFEERVAAEQKLDSWLVKPTDGIFARMNRRVSIPISRQLIKFPITPNMVSLFTLGVSFMAGVYFSLGGYWNALLGAVLSVFASILDGSDGEVARLKLQESAFGCWLETICDQLYYLMIFAGMTIGLTRSSGTRTYLVWGGLLLVGAVLSFLVTGLQRQRLTNGRPEQLLGIWQTQAERRSSNPFLYLGRHTEFIIRRCFLPYLILFFALFNITNVLLVLAALGANLVWSIALYSHLTFSPARRPLAAPPVSA